MITVGDIVVTKESEEHFIPANTPGVVTEVCKNNPSWIRATWMGETYNGISWYTREHNVEIVGHVDA